MTFRKVLVLLGVERPRGSTLEDEADGSGVGLNRLRLLGWTPNIPFNVEVEPLAGDDAMDEASLSLVSLIRGWNPIFCGIGAKDCIWGPFSLLWSAVEVLRELKFFDRELVF